MTRAIRFTETRKMSGGRTFEEGAVIHNLGDREAARYVRGRFAEYTDEAEIADTVKRVKPNDSAADLWTPDLRYQGETVFILAGGNSLRGFDFDSLRGLHTIALNSTAKLTPFAEVLFFMDSGWYRKNREFVRDWGGEAVTLSAPAKRGLPSQVKRVAMEHGEEFPPAGTSPIRWGRSSGHASVSLAIAMGAGRIVLLGYDMCAVDGKTHCHDDYQNPDEALYEREFIPAFEGWNDAALRCGVEIVNASPASIMTEFPKVVMEDEIAAVRARA